MKPSLNDKLIQLSERLEELNQLLSAEDSTRDMDNYRKLSREHAEIGAESLCFSLISKRIAILILPRKCSPTRK